MKIPAKRLLAFVLTLAICLSLLPADFTAQAATVNYVYAGNMIKNWGTRGETATFLSPNAETFYAQNGVSYSSLSALSGATSTSAVPDSDLYDALHTLMYENVKNSYTSYDATRDLFQYTDCQNSGKTSNKISSFYSGAAIGPSWDSGKTWNREHVWPNSKSNGGSNTNTRRETDIMMLRPASVSENSGRSNTAYGESSKFYDPNEASGGVYDLRGDVARIVLYIYTCWGGSDYHDGALDYMWGSSGVIESKEILLKWMQDDPVDTWELGRNDSVESVTGTRNVYVDYPELAFLLFNEDVPTGYTSPSGGATESYTVTAVSSNTAWGSVSVNGYTVTATPKTGYEVAGYTLLSGTAQVTRNGNTFTVSPTSNAKLQIDFTPRSSFTVRYAQLGAVVNTATVYRGDAITLPGYTGQVPAEYTFLGWVETTLDKTETKPAFRKAGDSFTPTADITLYALYSQTESDGAGSNVFQPYTGTLTEGDYLIVYDNFAMVAAETSGKRLQYAAVTYTDGNVENPAEDMIWHFAPATTGWTMYNEKTGKYAGGNGTRNQAALLLSLTDFAMWTETVQDGGTYEFINVGNDAKGINPLLRKNSTYGFACYAKNTNVGGPVSLYKRGSGTVWYLTGQRVVTDQDGNAYETLAAALENVADGATLTLLQDVQEDVTVSKNVTLELDGFCVDGTLTVADGCTLLGTDGQTDDYTVNDDFGYGRIGSVVCQGSGKTAAGEGYMQVAEEDGTSFHRVDLSLTAMSLRATVAGVYYKSSFAGDEVAARHVDSFGVALSVVGEPTAQTILVNCGYSVFTGFKPGSNNSEATSTLLKNIMRTTNTDTKNQSNANTVIYGSAYILTDEGAYLFGAARERTLRQQVEGADTLWSALSDSQKASLQEMYLAYETVMESWNVPNLKGSLVVTPPDQPAQTAYVEVTSADQLTDGQYVMIVSTGYAPGVYADGWLTAVQPVVEDDKVTDTAGAVWTLDFEDGLVTITDANGVTIKPKGTATNGIASGSYQWNCSFEEGVAKFTGTGNYAITLASNITAQGLNRFRGYKTSTVTGSPTNYPCQFTLYKLMEN